MFCHKCGAQIAEKAEFCHKCGTKVIYENPEPQELKTATVSSGQREGNSENPVQEIHIESVREAMSTEGIIDYETDFKAFVDNYVRQATKFQSAKELLDSQVPQKFMWICFGIPAIIGFILGGPILALLIGLFFGYPAALLTDFIKGFSVRGTIEKISDIIDSDELIQFLNENLNYLSPYFHEWGYISYSGFGIGGALYAHTLNSIAASSFKVGTGFGSKQRCFVVIWIEPDRTAADSIGMRYYFSTAIRSPLPSKYVSMVKAVPILKATMEYYLNHYRKK